MFLSIGNHFSQSWEIVGNQMFAGPWSDLLELEIINDVPHVVYIDYNSWEIRLSKFENNAWTVPANGVIADEAGGTYRSVVDSDGNLYVAFNDADHSGDVSVKKWDGNSWQNVGSPGFGVDVRDGYAMQIACLSDNSLVVAYPAAHFWEAGDLDVYQFNGTVWEPIGLDIVGDTIGYISMAVLSNDDIYINYRTDNEESRVVKYTGTTWDIQTTPFDGYSTYRSFMQVGSNDQIIGWRADSGGDEYVFYTANNDVWEQMPSPNHLDVHPLDYSWAVEFNSVDNSWYAGYTISSFYGSYFKKFDGTDWNQVGDSIIYNPGGFHYSDLEFNSFGVPYYTTASAYNLMSLTGVAGLESNNLLADFSIYPNPSSSQITLSFSTQKAQFSLFDMNGKELLSKVVANQESIDVSSFEKGMYIVKIDGVAERLVID